MSEPPNQPKNTDVVLGGNAPPPLSGAVLGGIAGVRHRLKSQVAEHRIAALDDGLKYGDAGLELIIQALDDEAEQVRLFACFAFATESELLALLQKGVASWNKWRSQSVRLDYFDVVDLSGINLRGKNLRKINFRQGGGEASAAAARVSRPRSRGKGAPVAGLGRRGRRWRRRRMDCRGGGGGAPSGGGAP